jgi:dienelactone hydrolase
VVVLGHGFQLPPSQYAAYLRQLASFGYVALTVDFPASFSGPDNINEAKDLSGGVDWAAANATVGALVDITRVGMTGHSLGGKVALLAATQDPRVKAALVLDPVDGTMGCAQANHCPDVAPLMPGLHIPTGFLGELVDQGSNDCAPASQNFQTFYARTNAPSLQVTINGANHMSFLDDPSTCGFVCSFCTPATVPDAQIHALAQAYLTAFFERYLRGNAAYDTDLTGSRAQARYVATNQVSIIYR